MTAHTFEIGKKTLGSSSFGKTAEVPRPAAQGFKFDGLVAAPTRSRSKTMIGAARYGAIQTLALWFGDPRIYLRARCSVRYSEDHPSERPSHRERKIAKPFERCNRQRDRC
jgi:hypothetical protein